MKPIHVARQPRGRNSRGWSGGARVCLPLLLLSCLALAVGLAAGCNSGSGTLAQVDPDAVPQDPDYDAVFGIIQRECAPCHTDSDGGGGESTVMAGPHRAALGGAEPDLTTCAAILDELSGVDAEIRRNTMPPGAWPRLSSEEKLIIERWIENGAVAPCN